MINQITKGKTRQEKPCLKVMHVIDKNSDGTFSIGSNSPKLKEAVGPDVVQQAEETAHKPVGAKLPKASKQSKTEKPKDMLKDEKDAMTDEQRLVLKALQLRFTSAELSVCRIRTWQRNPIAYTDSHCFNPAHLAASATSTSSPTCFRQSTGRATMVQRTQTPPKFFAGWSSG